MVLSVPANTYTALQNARKEGIIIPRYFVWLKGKDRTTGALETVGFWTGGVAMTVQVKRPDTGAIVDRVYQPLGDRLKIPSIPMTMDLQLQSLTIEASRLSPAVINAARVYDVRARPIEIHMGLLDPDSRKMVDPATCIWDGIVDRMPIERAKAGDDGLVRIETSSHSRWLTIASAKKMSAEFFEERGDKAGKYISTIWKIPVPWGADQVVHERRRKPKERFFR